MALSLSERVDPSHGMLLVVDMQNDFCHRDGAAANAAATWLLSKA
jgi:nicotinamidase-related amidase